MSKQIGAREISEYAQKYKMPLGKDTPLSMEWCFEMSDKAYQQGRADAKKEINKIMDMDAPISNVLYEIDKWLKEQSNQHLEDVPDTNVGEIEEKKENEALKDNQNVVFNGEIMNLSKFSRLSGVSRSKAYNLLKKGYSIDEIIVMQKGAGQ